MSWTPVKLGRGKDLWKEHETRSGNGDNIGLLSIFNSVLEMHPVPLEGVCFDKWKTMGKETACCNNITIFFCGGRNVNFLEDTSFTIGFAVWSVEEPETKVAVIWARQFSRSLGSPSQHSCSVVNDRVDLQPGSGGKELRGNERSKDGEQAGGRMGAHRTNSRKEKS